MENKPWMIALMIAVAAYITKLWYDDYVAARRQQPNPRGLPGAVPAPSGAIIVAVLGAWVLLAAETWGELALGVAEKQTKITWLFAIYTLLAGVIEEIIFRGYLVIEKRGRAMLWAGIVGASLLFAALHPFLWRWKDGALSFDFGTKGWFSTLVVFGSSLWFYCVRFARNNPAHSLLPCFAAHVGKNLGVIVVKLSQGYLAGFW